MTLKETNAIVIIFDVGDSVSLPLPDEHTFFEKSRDCISWILRRKIISMNKDLVSILVTGTDEEGESLEDLDVTFCRNISLKYDFQVASWDMLYYIDKKVKPRNKMSDWVGSLSVAIEKLNILSQSYNLTNKTIVVFSDLAYTYTEAVGNVLKGIQNSKIEINVIGSDCFSKSAKNKNLIEGEPEAKKVCLQEELTDVQKDELIHGDKLLYMLWHWVGDLITVCSFSAALNQLSCYVQKKVRATPWNCVMDVADFKISVQVFKKVDRKGRIPAKLRCLKPGDQEDISGFSLTEVKRDKIMYYKQVDAKSFEIKEISIEEGDIIAGYRYGTSAIPFSDEDKLVLGYKPGQKCFSVLGFTPVDNVPQYSLVGEGCYIVVPRDKDRYAEIALSALIQAMVETGNVAIVRRVYSDNRGLSLGVLYPVVEELEHSNHKECLIYIELAFHEDIRVISLPRLRRIKKRVNEEQYSLIDKLIDEMDLMRVPSDDKDEVHEALELSKRYEVRNQFFSHCIVQKALYPNKSLPKEIPKHCFKSVYLPDLLCNKIEKFDKKLRQYFWFEGKSKEEDAVNARNKDRVANERDKSRDKEKTPKICFSELFNAHKYPPAEDIRILLESLSKLNFRPQEIVEPFHEETRKIRLKTLENFTDDYNYWMRRLRIQLGTEKELERRYWKGVVEGNLGLITIEEHGESMAKKEDADFFINSLKAINETEVESMEITKEEEEAINMLF